MKIVIAGAGEVGTHLAKMLSGSQHDISVIDSNPDLLSEISDSSDIITIEGDCTSFSALKRASVRKADLFLAVTHDENTNVLAATLAKQLGARKSIARIDNKEYLEPQNKDIFINMGIDYLFYPERVAAQEVVGLLGHSIATEYVDFADGLLSLVVFRLDGSSEFTGLSVAEVEQKYCNIEFRTVAISRDDRSIIPHSTDAYYDGDTVFIITTRKYSREVMAWSGKDEVHINNLMILGGSRIGVGVARELQDVLNVKLVEYDSDKAYRLAEILDKTLIINQDGHNIEAMLDEGLDNMDAFVAVTGQSETNILTAMLAKRMGVKRVIAEVENMTYIDLAESIGIDTIINKKLITASNIFRFTMNSDVQAIKCLTGSDAEVMEFIVKPNSPAAKSTIERLGMPREALIGGVVRGERVFIPDGSFQINPYDRVVVFVLPEAVTKMGSYFN